MKKWNFFSLDFLNLLRVQQTMLDYREKTVNAMMLFMLLLYYACI